MNETKEFLEDMFKKWNSKEKCQHNQWDIAIDLPICTHHFLPQKSICVASCTKDNPAIPIFCPIEIKKRNKNIKTRKQYQIYFLKNIHNCKLK